MDGERKTLRIVARWANGCNGSGSVAMLDHSVSVLHDHCNEICRAASTIAPTACNDFLMSPDASRTTAHLERLAAFWGTTVDDTRDRYWVGERDKIVDWLVQLRLSVSVRSSSRMSLPMALRPLKLSAKWPRSWRRSWHDDGNHRAGGHTSRLPRERGLVMLLDETTTTVET